MKKTYRPYAPDQILLLPPSLRDWLPEDHIAYFISDVVDSLDLSAITKEYEKSSKGYPPYNPYMMTKILIYGYANGVFSSRKIARKVVEDVAFRVLAAQNRPDFRTISEFRRRHLKAFKELFLQVLKIAYEAGLVKLGHVSLDGTKVKANASKHKAMSYGRMKTTEAELKKEIQELVERANAIDAREDRKYGSERGDDSLPVELQNRENRLRKIQEAMAAIEAEAEEKNPADAGDRGNPPKDPPPPPDRAQRNFTDPDSKIMLSSDKSFIQAYNAQVVVDSANQIIIAAEVTNQAADNPHLPSMIETGIQNLGYLPWEVSADAGYYSEANVAYLKEREIEAYIATGKMKHAEYRRSKAPRGRIPEGLSNRERMKRKLLTVRGRARYALRKVTVEPVFGQIKSAQGFRQFLLRGLEKVKGEWNLVCLAHNLRKLFRVASKVRTVIGVS